MLVCGLWRDHRGFTALKWDDVLLSKHCFNLLACDFYSKSFVFCYFLSCCILSVYFNIYTTLLACFSCVRTKNWPMSSPCCVCVCVCLHVCSHAHGCVSLYLWTTWPVCTRLIMTPFPLRLPITFNFMLQVWADAIYLNLWDGHDPIAM